MKSLFFTILILGGAFAAYDYFGAPPGKKVIFKSLNVPESKGPKLVLANPKFDDMPVEKAAVPETAKPSVEMTKPAQSAPAPAPAAVTKPASDPRFQPIEALTSNWMKIPASAFPREVKLLQDAMFKMSVGGSKVAAGGKAVAIGADNGVLTLAPTATSPARAQVPIDGTDLKAQLNESYEKWKVVRGEELKKLAASKAQAQSAPVAANAAGMVDTDGKPLRDSTSAYPLLVNAMKSGQVTEIKPENILRWYDPQPAQVQGKQGWAVRFECNVKTIFGLQPVEAQALVLGGRVIGWYYTGSGEEVP
ncbi:hypothetical protein [Prosthecobacter vanneervenii]|uniref:Uncharacterized protein n=1 Tax=Prosthecobacter vanneervenii TaxID=48466 RepID=A0A7W8DIS3_9BACT|nr:hypothetical protein [Prosthecobacter vanneervenii]MBB5031368.1 hypothetical protein [Prosthecobacter vanneervenii]